ncbi:hypothetical protein ATK36_5242 [Amycolatopsis sulphurea]|uniref:Uncharacterized protein n=1 Tax=Amycolatopsis sulphurea TaxID=76022 RepID=A0A2A9FHQ7_9PSEU|nr:hypothetical protein ATK36_5242 [Amycolatopsis sulphurea]
MGDLVRAAARGTPTPGGGLFVASGQAVARLDQP